MPRAKRRVTLFHNLSAGDADHNKRELTRLIAAAGYQVAYFDAKKCDIPSILDKPADLIAVAGGDGTIRRVALAARSDGPPIAVLPLGTANNIANSLGIRSAMQELIDGWRDPTLSKFHPIDVEAPWGQRSVRACSPRRRRAHCRLPGHRDNIPGFGDRTAAFRGPRAGLMAGTTPPFPVLPPSRGVARARTASRGGHSARNARTPE
jgi:Diacylglycerol kinase catalytic domain